MQGPAESLTRRARASIAICGMAEGMLVARVVVQPSDVVFVKGIVEASEGVAAMFAEHGGELQIAAPLDRAKDLTELIEDLVRDVGAAVDLCGVNDGRS
jgi:hypothetical protein